MGAAASTGMSTNTANGGNSGGNHSLPGSQAAPSTQWLSQVEIKTHQSGHRKLWMGPQFQLATYPRTHEMDAASPTPTEVGGYEGDLTRRQWGSVVTPSLWRFNDAINFQLGSGSWPSTPEMLSPEHQHLEARARDIAVVQALAEASQPEEDEAEADVAEDLFHIEV